MIEIPAETGQLRPRADPPSGPDPPYTGAGTLARVECTTIVAATDIPSQHVVTTFFMLSTSPGPSAADWTALGNVFRDNFYGGITATGTYPWNLHQNRWGQIRVYNMADAKPRPEKAYVTYTPSGTDGSLGPREVALCLSYYSLRNIARHRGRVYLGPWWQTSMTERPSAATMQGCLTLGKWLRGLIPAGTIQDWTHCVWSRTDATEYPSDHFWVNDVWDVHRERGMPETTRIKSP